MKRKWFVALAMLGFAITASAANKLGDAAPALQVAEWVKGQPVDLAGGRSNTLTVIEFWATWCPPCRTTIPHLSALQAKFKDRGVVIVGISGEDAEKVRPFVAEQGDKMAYTVAIDNGNRTAVDYMTAFGVEGIPHAFVVDRQGRIAWHGHPMEGLDQVLEQLLAGTFSLAGAAKRAEAREKLAAFAKLAASDGDPAQLDRLGRELVVLDKEVGGLLDNGKPFDPAEVRKIIALQALLKSYNEAVGMGDEMNAAELEKRIVAAAPKEFNFEDYKGMMQLQGDWQKYGRAATAASPDKVLLADLGARLLAAKVKEPMAWNNIAWALLTEQSLTHRDLPLALQLAKRANECSGGKAAPILDTYARALYDNGKVDEAIATQKQALALVTDEADRKELTASLKKYETAKKPAAK